jgi:flagellar motor switch protein FliN
MVPDRTQIQKWLIEEWTSRLTPAFGGVTGARPAASWNSLPGAPDPAEETLRWRQPFPPLSGAVWVVTSSGAATVSGAYVLGAVGVEASNSAEQKSEFLELLKQALAGLAQALTTRLKSEVICSGGGESSVQPGPASWAAVSLALANNPKRGNSPESLGDKPLGDKQGDYQVTFTVGIETALVEAIMAFEQAAETSAAAPLEPAGPPPPRSSSDNSKTFDLLLDVELPVAVSFGRAHIPLKDVLKLTTGSIVELDRAVAEPVEILVNDCVIARGEVVVVEGNFGVRVQEVVNRQQRLRTVQ